MLLGEGVVANGNFGINGGAPLLQAQQQGQANLAFYYSTGPVHVYVRIPSVGMTFWSGPEDLRGKILFLGHAEESVDPDFVPAYMPVHSSLSGPMVPDDRMFMGGQYKVQVNFSRYSWSVMQLLLAFPSYGRGAAPGAETFLDRGRFVAQNGDGFELWCRNAFFGTVNAAAYPDLPIGWYYPCVNIAGHFPRKLSREYARAQLMFDPLNVRRGVTGGYFTYSQDPKFFAQLPAPG